VSEVSPSRSRLLRVAVFTLVASFVGGAVLYGLASRFVVRQESLQLSDRLIDVPLVRTPDGLRVDVDGLRLTPEQFLELLAERKPPEGDRPWLLVGLDVTGWGGLAWISFGLAGQLVFTARMIVQWLASERARRSVVPVAFWWLSLTGSSMLVLYFIWRVEVVGLIGQATGWLIYSRNLILIYRDKWRVVPADPGVESGPPGEAAPATEVRAPGG